MIIDSALEFSNAQAITAAAASTNYVDLGTARDIGTGEPLYIAVSVDVAFTDTGSNSSLTVSLQGDSTTTFTPDGTRDLFIIPALAAAGSIYYARLQPTDAALAYRYIQLYYTPVNGDLATGSVSASIVKDIQKFVGYPNAYTIV